MGILKRMTDMTKASLNEWLDKVEDPVMMMNQYIRDMEQEIGQAEQTVARQLAGERQLKQRSAQAEAAAAERGQQAEQALAGGQEELARKLLGEQLTLGEQAQHYGELAVQQCEQTAALFNELEHMREELETLRSKRKELASRAEAAKARQQVAAAHPVHSIQRGGAASGFARMEEKIGQLEAEADVMRMPGNGNSAPQAAQTQTLQIEEQLNALKQKLSGGAKEE